MKNQRNRRTHYLVNKKFQLSLISAVIVLMLSTMLFGAMITAFFFLYMYPSTRVAEMGTLPTYFTNLAILALIVVCFVVAYGILATHRIVGPFFRFRLVMEALQKGDFTVRPHLRRRDQWRDFAALFNQTLDTLTQRIQEERSQANRLKDDLEELE